MGYRTGAAPAKSAGPYEALLLSAVEGGGGGTDNAAEAKKCGSTPPPPPPTLFSQATGERKTSEKSSGPGKRAHECARNTHSI